MGAHAASVSAANRLLLAAALAVPGAVSGQPASTGAGAAYPVKPIRIITSEAGGGSDLAARTIAQGIAGSLGQAVVVENRTASLAPELVAKAPADGYALHVNGTAFWLGPLIRKAAYHPVNDFATITILTIAPTIFVVHPSLPVKSVRELISLARARPGALNYGSASVGSSSHLGMELFKSMAGIDIVHIPFKGTGSAMIGLIGGQVQLMSSPPSTVAPHTKSGKLRAVAVTSAQPSALFPELPTVAATVPDYEAVTRTGVWAPARTPASVINRLNQEIVRAFGQADVKDMYFKLGYEVVGSTPEQMLATVKSEMASLGKVIRDAGIREE